MNTREPYHGLARKLVLAFDVGTTYSGISYSLLDPGLVPITKGVTRFPAQERVGGDSKIPSIIYYDQDGVACAFGAETQQEAFLERAEEEGLTKVEWFKLHLRPKSMPTTPTVPPLPKCVTVVTVFADFLRYLYKCAKSYIEDTYAGGFEIWSSVEDQIDFVLTHPNGWEGAQQSQMRRAAVQAGLVPDNATGQARIQFVTEGEASLHFCIESGLTTDAMKDGNGVIIVDAGGGTIDLSAYVMTPSSSGSSFEEISPPQCLFNGSVFVTGRARDLLEGKLKKSRFADDIDDITRCFDKSTKLRFSNSDEPAYIKFGAKRDKDLNFDIRNGQLKLLGTDVAALFEPSISAIIKAIGEIQRRSSRHSKGAISTIFLVGGFAASDWLFSQLRTRLEPLGLDFCRPDSHVNKAVADGAISFYFDHFVSVRVSRFTYGTNCSFEFDHTNPEHVKRSHLLFTYPSGKRGITNGFYRILPEGTQVSETKEFRSPMFQEAHEASQFNALSTDILSYSGSSEDINWTDKEPDMFVTHCTIDADTSRVPQTLRPQRGSTGTTYYTRNFDIILSFGLTELKAQLSWVEQGTEKRSPATIVYDPNESDDDSDQWVDDSS